jgi:hypothetical protein
MFKIILYLSILVFLLSITIRTNHDFDVDLGGHILTGKIIWNTKSVPKTNLYSYTNPNFRFINTTWFSELIFFGIHFYFGNIGLQIIKVIILMSAYIITLITAFHFSKNITGTLLAFLILSPILTERVIIRPEIFSYLLTSIFLLYLLRLYISKYLKWKIIFLLLFLQLFWVNLQIYFILGPILTFIFIFAKLFNTSVINNIFSKQNGYVLLFFISILIINILNPNLLNGALMPLTFFQNYGLPVGENQSLWTLIKTGNYPQYWFYLFTIIFTCLSSIFAGSRYLIIRLGLLSLILMPMFHVRSFTYLYLLQLPILAFNLSKIPLLKFSKVILISIIFINIIRSYRLVNGSYYRSLELSDKFDFQVPQANKSAVEFIISNQLNGNIFNSYDIGSYLNYNLYPNNKIYVDNRPEAYPEDFFQKEYIPVLQNPVLFNFLDQKWHFNIIIVNHSIDFVNYLLHRPNYTIVYLDPSIAIFIKTIGRENFVVTHKISEANIINEITSNQTIYEPQILSLYAQTLFNYNFRQAALIAAKTAYLRDPQNYITQNIYGHLLQEMQIDNKLSQVLLKTTQIKIFIPL